MNYFKNRLVMATTAISILSSVSSAYAVDTTYNRVDSVMDWGTSTTKLIVDMGQKFLEKFLLMLFP